MTEEKGEHNRTERGDRIDFEPPPIIAYASYSLSQCLTY